MADDVLAPDQIEQIKQRVTALMPAVRLDLDTLVRIPSVSLDAFDQQHVEDSATAVARLLRSEGLDVEIVREGGRPAVIGHLDGPPGSPTITLYAHHDVQPPGDEALWDSPPFEPTERNGRLYGRGAADDKAGVMAHIAALRAFPDGPPVGVTVFVEGEEEIGSDSLLTILERHSEKLRADAIVLADSGNWDIGEPALTVTLRGLIRVVVTVTTLDHGVHSGMFGGAVPDAITTLIRLIATLHDADGNVAVEGLKSGEASDLDYDEARLRLESGLLDGVQMIGSGSILTRLWNKPSLTTIGFNAPTVERSSNTLVPSASAKLSMRIAPDEDTQEAYALLRAHLERHMPWGARMEIHLDDEGPGFDADADGPVYDQARAAFTDAWGVEPVDIGAGGSIPFVARFAETFPDAAILVTGVEDPDGRAHGANESLHLGEFERVCQAEALLLARLGAMTPVTDREHDLVVLGATGFVGRLLAAYLARNAPTGLRVALAGRSRERLEKVRSGLPTGGRDWPLVVCDATDAAQVADLAGSTRVVVTTVGPYARYGLPLVRACAAAGTHYADLTGEVLFVRDAVEAAHETAVGTGARIVTSCGFDSIPSDLGVHLLYRAAERLGLGGLGDTTLLVTSLSGGFSGGTVDSMRSQLEALEADPSRRRVVFDPFALSTDRAAEPDRSGQRDAMYVFRDATTGRWTAPWVMAAYNSRIVRRSDSLLDHAYGPGFRYREAVGFGRGTQARLSAYALAAGLGTAFAAMSNRYTRSVADRLLPSPGEGPDEKAREEGHFRVELRTTTESGRGLLAVVAAKGDPGYAATAVMLGESALCLAADPLESAGGVLTPAVAMGDALVERLRIAGMTLTVGPAAA